MRLTKVTEKSRPVLAVMFRGTMVVTSLKVTKTCVTFLFLLPVTLSPDGTFVTFVGVHVVALPCTSEGVNVTLAVTMQLVLILDFDRH